MLGPSVLGLGMGMSGDGASWKSWDLGRTLLTCLCATASIERISRMRGGCFSGGATMEDASGLQ